MKKKKSQNGRKQNKEQKISVLGNDPNLKTQKPKTGGIWIFLFVFLFFLFPFSRRKATKMSFLV